MSPEPRHFASRRRPAASWPASLLPASLLVALLTGATASNTSGVGPVVDMVVTGTGPDVAVSAPR